MLNAKSRALGSMPGWGLNAFPAVGLLMEHNNFQNIQNLVLYKAVTLIPLIHHILQLCALFGIFKNIFALPLKGLS